METTIIRLDDIIKQVSEKNKNGLYSDVLGVSIEKDFMPSVANLVGTDLKKYNVVRYGRFAFNPMHVGRDEKLPIARYKEEEPALVSPAYMMFELKGNLVSPDYLELIFKAPYFDRLCWFHSDASVRGGLTWEDFANIEIVVPTLEEQHQIIRRFNGIKTRIAVLESLNEKLFEKLNLLIDSKIFGQIKNDDLNAARDLELPNGWRIKPLIELCDCQSGYAFYKDGYTESGIRIVDLGNITTRSEYIKNNDDKYVSFDKYISNKYDKFRLSKNDLIMVMTDRKSTMELLGKTAIIDNDEGMLLNQRVYRIRSYELAYEFLYVYLNSEQVHYYHMSHALGTAQKYVNNGDIDGIPVIVPDKDTYLEICKACKPIIKTMLEAKKEIELLTSTADLLTHLIK